MSFLSCLVPRRPTERPTDPNDLFELSNCDLCLRLLLFCSVAAAASFVLENENQSRKEMKKIIKIPHIQVILTLSSFQVRKHEFLLVYQISNLRVHSLSAAAISGYFFRLTSELYRLMGRGRVGFCICVIIGLIFWVNDLI